jgi:hypothetical protein
MFRPEVYTRRAYLQMMKGLILSSPPVTSSSAGQSFCADPSGRNFLVAPEEAAALACGDCKKLSILAARRYIDAGARRVDICMTVTPPPGDEHVFLRVDGRFVDPSVEAGAPIRRVGDFIAETVWVAPPS